MEFQKKCAGHIIYRVAFVGNNEIINPQKIFDEIEVTLVSPKTPDWLKDWVDSEEKRPRPPMQNNLL